MNNRRFISTLVPFGIGAACAYFLDHEHGHSRRMRRRDALLARMHEFQHFLDVAGRDLRNRMQGIVGNARYQIQGKNVDDSRLLRRVAAKIGRYTSHPRSISVTVENGEALLRGLILKHEVKSLIHAVSRIPGVKAVRNELEAHSDPDHISALQGGKGRSREHLAVLQENWSPALRLLLGISGAYLALDGMRRPRPSGGVKTLAGVLLLGRCVSNLPIRRLLGFDGRRGIFLQKTVTFDVPVSEIFDFFQNVENYPHFMRNVREIRDLGQGRSHWVVRGPAGMNVAWDAEITRFEASRLIAWKSVPGSRIAQSGRILFEDRGGSRTRVTIQLSYNPPAGALGHAIASLFGANPKREMDEDLARVKSFFETGKPAHDVAKMVRLGRS